MQNNNHSEILLESGTNELEIIEFIIAGELFGINVAKITEIMTATNITPMQKSHPCIEGVIRHRDKVITVLDLAKYLDLEPSDAPEKDIFIVANFNSKDYAFHVHAIAGIDRISWTQIRKPDKIIYGGEDGVATGIAEYEDRLISILDFEKIVIESFSSGESSFAPLDTDQPRPIKNKRILMAEDSMVLSKMIIESLHKAGYVNIVKAENGKEAWDILNDIKQQGKDVTEELSCLISDIEMPQMDGHRLTKLVKSDPELKKLPVVLFSSIINDDMRIKGKELGADYQISKPEIGQLVGIIDSLTE